MRSLNPNSESCSHCTHTRSDTRSRGHPHHDHTRQLYVLLDSTENLSRFNCLPKTGPRLRDQAASLKPVVLSHHI